MIETTPIRASKLGALNDLQRLMDAFVESRGWYAGNSPKPQTPQNLAASISMEAAEVLEHFQWGTGADAEEVAGELADVVLYAAQLANVLDIDLDAAVSAKLALNETRWAPRGGAAPWQPRTELQAS